MDTLFLEQFLVWNIPFLAGCLIVGILYVYLFERFKQSDGAHKKPLFFFLALISFYFATGSPLAAASHLAFSLHMLQMSLLYAVKSKGLYFYLTIAGISKLTQKQKFQAAPAFTCNIQKIAQLQ
ncbi:cytochrome c oxidase assembly protein [Lentibacillus sp.]|uniref:cytochrome c oxidase assembly protein n=1 Tax=Lentibacillus sp. TaxID=1925746 RepID=UPI002B4B414A|nr:cytochrome c oxidase assembly protein [Lentibacillus sp.]HLS09807.1 cytochrome c oxidase assembly protein [Lentibacillus sp.]